MKRYDVEDVGRGWDVEQRLTESQDGEWVRYDDHAATLSAAQARIAELEAERAAAGWRPIVESDLPDGLVCLVLVASNSGDGQFATQGVWNKGKYNYGEHGYWFLWTQYDARGALPTHWMPLPPHPNREQYSGEEDARRSVEAKKRRKAPWL